MKRLLCVVSVMFFVAQSFAMQDCTRPADDGQNARWRNAQQQARAGTDMATAQATTEMYRVIAYFHSCSKREWNNIQGPRYHFFQDSEARALIFTSRLKAALRERCDLVADLLVSARDIERALLKLNLNDARRRSVVATLNTAEQRLARLPANCRGRYGFGPRL